MPSGEPVFPMGRSVRISSAVADARAETVCRATSPGRRIGCEARFRLPGDYFHQSFTLYVNGIVIAHEPLHRVEELTSKINSGKERYVRVLSVDSHLRRSTPNRERHLQRNLGETMAHMLHHRAPVLLFAT